MSGAVRSGLSFVLLLPPVVSECWSYLVYIWFAFGLVYIWFAFGMNVVGLQLLCICFAFALQLLCNWFAFGLHFVPVLVGV